MRESYGPAAQGRLDPSASSQKEFKKLQTVIVNIARIALAGMTISMLG